jgi:hypothetical protein
VEAAFHAGRLALVTFHDDSGMGSDGDLDDSYPWKIVMNRRKAPRTAPDTYEIFLEADDVKQMEALARELDVIKVVRILNE